MHEYYHTCTQKYITVIFMSMLPFSFQCYFFSVNVTDKILLSFNNCIFLKFPSLNFPSCILQQVNHCQIFIRCLIMKIHVQEHKQSLILFHPYGMMITFAGFMKITDNAYGVIKYCNESIL